MQEHTDEFPMNPKREFSCKNRERVPSSGQRNPLYLGALIRTHGPVSQADGHDDPRLLNELVPSLTAMIDDLLGGAEDPVRQLVVANERPDGLDRVQLRRARRQGQKRDGVGPLQLGETCRPAWSS